LAREVERGLAADEALVETVWHRTAVGIDQLDAHEHGGRDIGREGVANARGRDGERRPGHIARAVARPRGTQDDVQSRADHVGVVDAAPEMPAIGHVTALTLESPSRRRAPAPFLVRILEGLARQSRTVGRELMAARAELRAQKGRGPRESIVGEARAGRPTGRRAVASQRPDSLLLHEVTVYPADFTHSEGG